MEDDKALEVLEEHIEDIGIDATLNVMDLEEGEEVTLTNKAGTGFYAQGKGKLFIGFLPKEAFEE